MTGMVIDLKTSVYAVLAADLLVRDFVGNPIRLYQFVPQPPVWPYLTWGTSSLGDDSVQFLDAAEVFFNIDVWSDTDAKDFDEADEICSALRRALNDIDLTLVDNRCVSIYHHSTLVFRDADGVTVHGVVTFRAETEENLRDAQDMSIAVPTGGLGTT